MYITDAADREAGKAPAKGEKLDLFDEDTPAYYTITH